MQLCCFSRRAGTWMMIKDISMIHNTYHTNNTYHIIIYYESISQYTEFLLSFSLFPFRNSFPLRFMFLALLEFPTGKSEIHWNQWNVTGRFCYPGLLWVVKRLKFQTPGGFRYIYWYIYIYISYFWIHIQSAQMGQDSSARLPPTQDDSNK